MTDVNLSKKGNRIEVRSHGALAQVKTIPGHYLTSLGVHTLPLSIETLALLRLQYGGRITLTNELKRWERTVMQSRDFMRTLASKKDAKLTVLPRVAPKLSAAMKARTYQRVGARFIAETDATGVFDDPGLGKTLIAMGGLLESETEGPYLVIAPKTAARPVWEREIKRFLPSDHRVVVFPEGRTERIKRLRLTRMTPKTWVIIHPEMCLIKSFYRCHEPVWRRNKRTGKRKKFECGYIEMIIKKRMPTLMRCGHERSKRTIRTDDASYPRLFTVEWGAIIIDESHDSLIMGKRITQRRNGIASLKIREGGKKLALSGTPFNSKPEQLWGTLNWLDPVTFSAYDRWASLFFERGGYTGYEIGTMRPDREKMLWASLDGLTLRRTKLEVAKDLPPKTYMGTPLSESEDSPHGIWLPMESSQQEHYEQMQADSIAHLDSGRLESVSALAELTRLKQFACADGDIEQRKKWNGYEYENVFKFIPKLPSNKYDWIKATLEEWGYPRSPVDKVIVVSFYTSILEMMASQLEKDWKTGNRPISTIISGRVSSVKERQNRLAAINSTDRRSPQVLFLNVKAGGVALTVDSASRMIFLSETRIPDQQLQAEDRIHRVSNPRPCFYYYLRSTDSVDVGTALINQELQAGTTRLLDTRRGVEYVRNVISLSRR